MASLSIILIIQLQPHPPHYHLIIMSSYNCNVSADFFDYFDAGHEGTIYSSSTKENKREKTPVPSKPKGKAHALPRKPRGQPQGNWSGTSEEGDGLVLDDLLTPFVLVIPKAVKNSIPLELLRTSYNNMGHTVCRNNPHQPYPIRASIITRTEGVHHFQERYNDLYLKDQIWAGKKYWEKCHQHIKMSPFCEGLVTRGLWEFYNREEEVPPVVNASIRFAAVLSCELFEVVDKVSEELTTCDLMVGLSFVHFSSE